jgi:hypothetical protein
VAWWLTPRPPESIAGPLSIATSISVSYVRMLDNDLIIPKLLNRTIKRRHNLVVPSLVRAMVSKWSRTDWMSPDSYSPVYLGILSCFSARIRNA